MQELQGFDIRYTTLEDEPYLVSWIKQEKNLLHFPMKTEEEILLTCKNWVGFSRFKSSLTATLHNEPVGMGTLFLMPYRKVAHLCMFYLVVDQNKTNKGIGSSLLKNVLNLAEKYFFLESIYAEIFENSPGIKLLQKFGFMEIAKQPHFVKDHLNGQDRYLSRILLEYVFKKGEKK